MHHAWTTVLLAVFAIALTSQETKPRPSPAQADEGVMLAAVSRDNSMLAGGINESRWTRRGTVFVEPIARLTLSGAWVALPCSAGNQEGCRRFAREYLSKPHTYTVVSADGAGATVQAKPASLSECSDYAGEGLYFGAALESSALAAASGDGFAAARPVRRLTGQEAEKADLLFTRSAPDKQAASFDLRILSLVLAGKTFYIAHRAFQKPHKESGSPWVFAVGQVIAGKFEVAVWKENLDDEDERVLGAISLKSGQDFLITVVNDPEGHWFCAYGIVNGKLKMVFQGGGASC